MKIVVAVRCRNEQANIDRFIKGYNFADAIVVSDGGSTDNSIELLLEYKKVFLYRFDQEETVNGETWNPDAPHMNFVINMARLHDPDWIIFDDMDCAPNALLRANARLILETCGKAQVNAFRLYMWGEENYFPKMNNGFHPDHRSLWAWRPDKIDIHADETKRHGTFLGVTSDYCGIDPPMCLLHRSWHPDTITKKVNRYNKIGLNMDFPLDFAGTPEALPEWAHE